MLMAISAKTTHMGIKVLCLYNKSSISNGLVHSGVYFIFMVC